MKRLLPVLAVAALLSGWSPRLAAQEAAIESPIRVYESGELGENEMPRFDEDEMKRVLRYPDDARNANIEGLVVVQCVIDTMGRAIELQAIESASPLLTEAAIDAIQRLQFRPGRKEGRPVAVRATFPVMFKFNEE